MGELVQAVACRNSVRQNKAERREVPMPAAHVLGCVLPPAFVTTGASGRAQAGAALTMGKER